MEPAELEVLVGERLGGTVRCGERLPGGRNSQVYLLSSATIGQLVAKVYFRYPSDHRRRLNVEFGALSFLWKLGERAVPEPIVSDPANDWAVYRYVEGCPVDVSAVTWRDIDQVVAFQSRLIRYGRMSGGRALPDASEACFSLLAVIENIERRIERLRGVPTLDEQARRLRRFLDEKLDPARYRIVDWVRETAAHEGLVLGAVLPSAERTLSPSDFGFHNAVRGTNGALIFLDFEHFGWDDPAKLVADFILHPAMTLSYRLRQRFSGRMVPRFPRPEAVWARLRVVLPLLALTWCTICLNEFIPSELRRRRFASIAENGAPDRRREQLAKAEVILDGIRVPEDPLPLACEL